MKFLNISLAEEKQKNFKTINKKTFNQWKTFK